MLESYLPPWTRAEELGRILLENMSWMFQIVTFQQVAHNLIPAIYGPKCGRPSNLKHAGPHDLALLFGVLAVGALADLSLPPYNKVAQRYYVLSRVALAIDPILENTSLSTVKALHLISVYNGMSGKESNMPNTYTVLNIGGRLAQKVSLSCDCRDHDISSSTLG